jgi:hypothetical protein
MGAGIHPINATRKSIWADSEKLNVVSNSACFSIGVKKETISASNVEIVKMIMMSFILRSRSE